MEKYDINNFDDEDKHELKGILNDIPEVIKEIKYFLLEAKALNEKVYIHYY